MVVCCPLDLTRIPVEMLLAYLFLAGVMNTYTGYFLTVKKHRANILWTVRNKLLDVKDAACSVLQQLYNNIDHWCKKKALRKRCFILPTNMTSVRE